MIAYGDAVLFHKTARALNERPYIHRRKLFDKPELVILT